MSDATFPSVTGLGTAINVAAVVAGATVGVVIGHRLSAQWRTTMLQGLGTITLILGVRAGIQTENAIFVAVSVVLGGVIGEALRIEDRLETLGERLRRRFAKGERHAGFVEGFVDATLLFCIGPLAILGAIADGLRGDSQLLVVKSALDGVVAVVFASTLGWGVAFSAIPVGLYQGLLTLGAGGADRILDERMVTELTATGGVLLVGIAIRILDLKQVRVASFLPSLILAPLLVWLFAV